MFRNLPFKANEFAGEGHLIYVKDLSGNTIASFTYHPDGLRKTKTVNDVTYHYHYDGSNLIRITDDNGQTVWAFTWNDGEPISVTNRNGETFFYITNHRGDVVRIVDENGTTIASYSYDPWGKLLSSEPTDARIAGQPIRYAGYVYDIETQLYYLQARYYDPETARFLSRDPEIGHEDLPLTQNAYVYATDNPIMFTDPDGNNPYLIYLAVQIGGRLAIKYIAKKGAKKVFKKVTKKQIKKRVAGANTLKPGPYASKSIKAKGKGRKFSKAERDKINKIGYKSGCHSCGSKNSGTKSGNFIPDHQPPSALVRDGTPQRLYPHCKTCSSIQGGTISAIKRKGWSP